MKLLNKIVNKILNWRKRKEYSDSEYIVSIDRVCSNNPETAILCTHENSTKQDSYCINCGQHLRKSVWSKSSARLPDDWKPPKGMTLLREIRK